MNRINIPLFTAEASLYGTRRPHQTDRHAINSSRHGRSSALYSSAQHSVRPSLSGQGQDFPNQKCACKGCASGGGDQIGQCDTVCKGKTVYSKGSETYDYCKAALVRSPVRFGFQVPTGGFTLG
jgi:hypothetical protein